MSYLKTLWNAIKGVPMVQIKVKKNIKELPIIENDLFSEYTKIKYTYNEFLNILDINNKKLTNIQVIHYTKYGVYLLDVNAKGKRNKAVYSDKHVDIIKNTNSYKKYIQNQKENK
jgi:hypothetical protein